MRWNPDPIVFYLGSMPVAWYGLLFTLGLLAAIWMGHENFKKVGLPEAHASSLTVYLVAGLFIGAHLGYLLFYNFSAWVADPLLIFNFRQGLSSHGGGLGQLVALAIFVKVKRVSFVRYVDPIVATIVWLFPFIRLGNFFNSEIFGRETTVPWGVIFERWGFTTPRHPSQLYEVILNVGLIVLSVWLIRNYKRLQPGAICLLLLTIYFCGRFALEFFKEFQVVSPEFPFTMGQLLSLPPGLLCAFLLYRIRPIIRSPET